jgi:Rieske 2Fe-2S family protein
MSEYRLGPEAYLDEVWFRREQRQVVGRTWTLVAGVDELVEPGDYVTASIGDAPIAVVRDQSGLLRAFHNLCRHRGMVMLDGSGNTAPDVNCPYHHWRYALDGALRVVPQRKEQFPDLDLACWGLLPASVDMWEGMVFVHPDADAPSLASHLGQIPQATGSFRPSVLEPIGHEVLEARCNWKLFVENHIDVYHLWYLHERTLGDLDHTKFEHRTLDGHWVSYEPLRPDTFRDARLSARTLTISHLDERDRAGVGAHLLFPNQMFATSEEFFATYRAVPVAADRCLIDLRVRAEPGADADGIMKSVRSFIDEDISACEAVQVGVGSPYFSVGPLARTHEHPITLFQDHLLAVLDG